MRWEHSWKDTETKPNPVITRSQIFMRARKGKYNTAEKYINNRGKILISCSEDNDKTLDIETGRCRLKWHHSGMRQGWRRGYHRETSARHNLPIVLLNSQPLWLAAHPSSDWALPHSVTHGRGGHKDQLPTLYWNICRQLMAPVRQRWFHQHSHRQSPHTFENNPSSMLC